MWQAMQPAVKAFRSPANSRGDPTLDQYSVIVIDEVCVATRLPISTVAAHTCCVGRFQLRNLLLGRERARSWRSGNLVEASQHFGGLDPGF